MSEHKDGSRKPQAASAPMGLRELLDSTPDLIFACDASGRVQWINPAVERLTGLKSGEVLNRCYSALLDPSSRVSTVRAFRRMALKHMPQLKRAVALLPRAQNRLVLDVHVARHETFEGETVFVGTARPWDAAGAGAKMLSSPEPPRSSAASADLVSARGALKALHAERSADIAAHTGELTKKNSVLAAREDEIRARNAEIEKLTALVRGLQEQLEAARHLAITATERSTPAAAPSAAAPAPVPAPAPATTPATRTADMQRLESQLDEARSMVQLKSEYLATMSQEIRTPMTGIMGMTNLLLESELDTEQRSMVEVIRTSSGALVNLINDTLDFSRFDAGSLAIEHMGFDLRVTVEEVAQLLAPLANEKGLDFDARVHHEVPSRLMGDPGRLRQVLLNLSACAIRNSASGRVTIRIERIEENDQAVTLRFAVMDALAEGTPEAISKLYRCYADDDIHHARKQGGAGLSLAVARQVVTRMGGLAGLEHRPARGNALWFQVSFDKQAEVAQPNLAPAVQLRGLRALIVDPSKAARDAMVEMLTAWGCRVEAIERADEALTALRAGANQGDPYRVALIEMQLEGVGGEELGHAIRSENTLSATHTLLLTSLGRKGDAQRAQSMGFSAYLLKPLQWSELYEAMVEVLGRAESHPGASAPLITRHSLAESRRGRVRILLVEDSAVNQLVAEWALRRLGYSIDAVADATSAIEASELNHYDMILMDVHMPDMDGCKAASAIRARERGRHTPIVGMSGHAMEGDRARCIEAGMEECLKKPIDLGQLCAAVEQWTRGRKDAIERPAGDASPASGRTGKVVIRASSSAQGAVVGLGLSDDGGHSTLKESWGANEVGSGQPALKLVPGDVDAVGEGAWSSSSAAAQRVHESEPAAPLVPIDTARLEESCMGIPALREALLQTFRADVGPRMMRLAEAIVAGDPRRVEFEAHGLKGMSATIGAVACEAAFEEIERLGRDEDVRTASKLLQIAQGTAERTEQFISRLERILSQANEAA